MVTAVLTSTLVLLPPKPTSSPFLLSHHIERRQAMVRVIAFDGANNVAGGQISYRSLAFIDNFPQLWMTVEPQADVFLGAT
jgi:hypothetical protein